MTRERILYLDYTKAVGIIMIMMAHTFMWSPSTGWVCHIFCSVHVPLFFVVTGLLWATFPKEETFGTFVKKRTKALLVPYFWFSLFNAATTWSVLFLSNTMTEDRLKIECIELFITGNGVVWFLVTLFLAELFFFCVIKQKKQNIALITTAILAWCISFGLNSVIVNPIWTVISRALSAYGLIVVGYYSRMMLDYNISKKITISLLMLGVWLWLYIYARYNFEFFDGKFLKPWSSIPTMISGSLAIILLMSCIKKKLSIMEYIGKNSLLYMLCHPIFIKAYIILCVGRLSSYSPTTQGFITIVTFILIILASTLFGEVIKRKLPFVIGRKK